MQKHKGFTLVELIVVLVILAILVAITISGIYIWVGKARYNTDVHNAATINDSVYVLSEDPLVKEWATQSDNSQLIIWSCSHLGKAKGSIWFGAADELDGYTSLCALSSEEIETLLTKYNIPDKYANKLRELT